MSSRAHALACCQEWLHPGQQKRAGKHPTPFALKGTGFAPVHILLSESGLSPRQQAYATSAGSTISLVLAAYASFPASTAAFAASAWFWIRSLPLSTYCVHWVRPLS